MCRLRLAKARADNDDVDDADDGDDDVEMRTTRLTVESPPAPNTSFLADADQGRHPRALCQCSTDLSQRSWMQRQQASKPMLAAQRDSISADLLFKSGPWRYPHIHEECS